LQINISTQYFIVIFTGVNDHSRITGVIKTMKALMLTEYNKFEYKEVPGPEIGPDEVQFPGL